jgi:hypothetical protein
MTKHVLAILVMITSQAAFADWSGVKGLEAGAQIRIGLTDGKAQRGALQSATDESLVVTTSGGQETIERSHIAKLFSKKESHRGRHVLIGLGVGTAGGLAIGAATDHTCASSSCFIGPNLGKEIFTPLGALIGLAVGAAWPTGGWREVYRSK